jgi:hypothetical protein
MFAAADVSSAQLNPAARIPVASLSTHAGAGPKIAVMGPVLGHFYDSASRRLEPIYGIVGSASLGAELPSLKGAIVEVAPSQDYALAVSAETGQLSQLNLSDTGWVAMPLGDTIPGADRIAISANSASALVFSSASRHAQVVTGLPGTATISGELDFSALGGPIGMMAVNDTGEIALVSVGDGAMTVYAVQSKSAPAAVYRANSVSGLAFLRGSSDALMTSSAENRLVWLRDVSGTSSAVELANRQSGLDAPSLVAASEDGSRALVLSGDSVWSVPFSGAAATSVRCSCTPTRLLQLRGRDAYLLTDSATHSLAVLDGSSPAARILFIPVNVPRQARPEETK